MSTTLKHLFGALSITLLLAACICSTAQGQGVAIKKKKERDAIINKARKLITEAGLPGIETLRCTVRSESLRALHDSLWSAASDSSAQVRQSFEDVPISYQDGPGLILHRREEDLLPSMEGMGVFERGLDALDAHLRGIFGCWLRMEEMAFGRGTYTYNVRRLPSGYRIDAASEYKKETISTFLSPDYVVRSIEVNDPEEKLRALVAPGYTRIGDRVRLDSARIDLTVDGKAGYLTMVYSYAEIAGRLLPVRVAVTSKGLVPLLEGGGEDRPMNETLIFSNHRVE